VELSVEALQGGSLPADVNGYDFLVESVAAGVGPGKPNWQRHVDPWRVAALDFESSHEAAQLCRYIGQVLSRFLRLLRVYEVPSAASATPPMVAEMLPAPVAASLALRVISLVVALCSSTAAAMVAEMSLIWLITPLIVPIAYRPLVSV
jgi:hypothetical protein